MGPLLIFPKYARLPLGIFLSLPYHAFIIWYWPGPGLVFYRYFLVTVYNFGAAELLFLLGDFSYPLKVLYETGTGSYVFILAATYCLGCKGLVYV